MSDLGWVDFSSEDRERVRHVMAMMREPGTLDELGIGQIRDAFADLLFPGISTIQTRAKYFITVPRILRDYYEQCSANKRKAPSIESYLKDAENNVAKRLTEVHGDDETGIIGRTQIDKGGVARRPSSVYWNGLRQLGIIDTQSSLAEFCRHYGNVKTKPDSAISEFGEDDTSSLITKQIVHLPKGHSGNWQEDLTLNLSVNEARFLVNKIKNAKNLEHSVLGQLYLHGLTDEALSLNDKFVRGFTQLQAFLKKQGEVSAICKSRLEAAEAFSLAMEGAHLRYNIVLARNNEFDEKVAEYESDYHNWAEIAKKSLHEDSVDKWLDIAEIKAINPKTKTFIQEFIKQVQTGASLKEIDTLVESQAKNNKKKRSLLYKKLTHQGWVGIRRLDYRWSAARPILADIQQGLENAKSR
ncbi:hypothetical protein JJQ94_11735 [Pseudoalteromonas sp. GCY]|uniref:DUF6361 family protein n=1 Tax=Pseudoalteromonas sp. GCY TaxID=2003316 RepID=UPI00114552C1|nr:DUF6361 family protein [Pseudoalteromonas sp. GCY]QQQ68424.1 hypothetical protein JJQ94_11735 [Pseudoalteromonas sp. GCY]